jgi:DNA-binding NtrC family response regulator
MEPIYGKRVDATPIDMSTRMLLVDEEADVDASLREVPEQNGFKVVCSESPLPALANFEPPFYNLAILDIKLREMNRFFYREIKELDKNLTICSLTAGKLYYGAYSEIFSLLPASYFMGKAINNAD